MSDMKFPHLTRAPILEAVVEIRVATKLPVEVQRIAAVRDRLRGAFPTVRPVHHFRSTFSIGEDGKAQQASDSEEAGFRLESADKMFVSIVRADSIMVSRQKPYTNWGDLLAMLRVVWREFCAEVTPTSVRRLGVRYINLIELGRDEESLRRTLTAGPSIPPAMPQQLVSFATRVVVPMPALNCVTAVVQELNPAAGPGPSGGAIIRLDVDAFSEDTIDAAWDTLAKRLEDLRTAKNTAFFGSLDRSVTEALA